MNIFLENTCFNYNYFNWVSKQKIHRLWRAAATRWKVMNWKWCHNEWEVPGEKQIEFASQNFYEFSVDDFAKETLLLNADYWISFNSQSLVLNETSTSFGFQYWKKHIFFASRFTVTSLSVLLKLSTCDLQRLASEEFRLLNCIPRFS